MTKQEFKEVYLSKKKKIQVNKNGKFLLVEKAGDQFLTFSLTEKEARNLYYFFMKWIIMKDNEKMETEQSLTLDKESEVENND